MIQAVPVDERKYLWEGSDPVFLVILFDGGGVVRDGDQTSWAVDTHELSGCGVLDAIEWAKTRVRPGGAWAVGLVDTKPDLDSETPAVGFTYLEGYDLNTGAADLSPWQRGQFDAMLARRGGISRR